MYHTAYLDDLSKGTKIVLIDMSIGTYIVPFDMSISTIFVPIDMSKGTNIVLIDMSIGTYIVPFDMSKGAKLVSITHMDIGRQPRNCYKMSSYCPIITKYTTITVFIRIVHIVE